MPILNDFLSAHSSKENVVSIRTEPEIIYFEESRDSLNLNFDFTIRGLTSSSLTIKFIKTALYDQSGNLISFRHLNHNGVGTPSIHTLGKYVLEPGVDLDLFNPFHSFPKDMPIDHLRYMFTFTEHETNKEYYYGNVLVKPVHYTQKVELTLPMRGVLTVLDGHDFYSHHRRFAMSIVRKVTKGQFVSNFSRYAVDFTVVGSDGNLRKMKPEEAMQNYDFHFTNIKKFYTHEAPVYAPADGEIVVVVNHLDDLYDTPFDLDKAIHDKQLEDMAGNYIVIQHHPNEYSHLFHLLKGSAEVTVGQHVSRGQLLAKIGFSGTATTYSHLHYQLMDGKNFLTANPLPCHFSDVKLIYGSKVKHYDKVIMDTGDILYT